MVTTRLHWSFDLRGRDLATDIRAARWRAGGWRGTFVWVALVAATIAVESLVPGLPGARWLPLAGLVLAAILAPLAIRRARRAGPLRQSPARLRAGPGGWEWETAAASLGGDWSALTGVEIRRGRLHLGLGAAGTLSVPAAAFAPQDPDEVLARLRGWMAGRPGGAVVDGTFRPASSRARGVRPRGGAWRTTAAVLPAALALVVGAVWLGPAIAAISAMGLLWLGLWWAERGRRAMVNTVLAADPFWRGRLAMTLTQRGYRVQGADWSLDGRWGPGVRLSARRGALVLSVGGMVVIPVPAESLKPHSPAEVARFVRDRWIARPT